MLFIGDVVGDPGIEFLEDHLPALREELAPDVVIANVENSSITGPASVSGFGLTPVALNRIFAAGVDVATSGNHSFDGNQFEEALGDCRVLRPLNLGLSAPGKGALVWESAKGPLGIINVAGRSAIGAADDYADAAEAQLRDWHGEVEGVVVDMHGNHIEKQILAARLDGKASAVFGTHTHVATRDAQILPLGTGYITDVGMVGPTGGVSGVEADYFREWSRRRVLPRRPFALALGPMTFGAVVAELQGLRATSVRRVGLHLDCFDAG